MQDLNDLVYFAHVVDHRGFAPAARALAVPKSRLSRRIAALEQRLGVRLIQRSTRRFSVTDVGESFYRHCKAMLLEAQAAQDAVAQARGEPRGVVRVSCPIALLHARVADMLVEFMALNPQVEVHLTGSNRVVDVVAEGYDIAIRARTPPLEDSSLALRELAQRDWYLVASPAFCDRHPLPAVPADLDLLPSLGDGLGQREHRWQLIGPGGRDGEHRLPATPGQRRPAFAARRRGGRAGRGAVAGHAAGRRTAQRAARAPAARLVLEGRRGACGVSVPAGDAAGGARVDRLPGPEVRRAARRMTPGRPPQAAPRIRASRR